ncbi:sodium:phosphate symporter [Haloplanus rubicundus]|uniref:Sodium:phosphate symporter n=1 Tax=Haloplanus rubicundus TaxID=1547898 RepID=A0A345E2E7_9EURY|nr:sodium:phosphate symporter [Haloplanus rubicundus]AXG06369.1 sodium:phosphate symporter [Haloplanus rubicundus]
MTGPDETSEAATRATRLLAFVSESGPLWAGGLTALLLFLFAVQLLGTATEAAEPLIERLLRTVVVDNGSALGLSWLATYGVTNGSVVAALTLSLLRSGIVSASEAFLMIAGSRLGAGAIVVLVGTLDYFQKRRTRTLRERTSLGLLTFVVTFTVYLPVTALGIVVLTTFQSELFAATGGLSLPVRSLRVFEPITETVTRSSGPEIALVIAIALLLGSLWLFDEVLERVETESVRTYLFRHFEGKWTAFGIGFLITGVTTSIAFSLGVVVPLYNRQFVRRDEIVPYILGANIGTLFDTLVVAFVLETTVGVAIVLLLMALGTLLTLTVLVGYEPYTQIVDVTQDRLLTDRRFFVGFAILLVAVPLVLLLVPHL